MSAPELDVSAVARLARLALTEEEISTFQSQLGRVLEHIEHLKKVDVSNVTPTAHAHPVYNVVRADEPGESLPSAEFLKITPRSANSLVVVPKVLE